MEITQSIGTSINDLCRLENQLMRTLIRRRRRRNILNERKATGINLAESGKT